MDEDEFEEQSYENVQQIVDELDINLNLLHYSVVAGEVSPIDYLVEANREVANSLHIAYTLPPEQELDFEE